MNANLRIRGQILSIVKNAGPSGVTETFLASVFTRAGKEWALANLEANLAYLCDRGYLRREQRTDDFSGVQRWIYRLTATGTDLLEGTISPDPGVLLDGLV